MFDMETTPLNILANIELTEFHYNETENSEQDARETKRNGRKPPAKICDVEALLHVVKSSLGTGVLAISEGFKNAGYVVGFIGTIFVGILCTHCAYIMVKCSIELREMLNKSYLSYTETVEQAFLQSSDRKFNRFSLLARNCAEGIMFFTYYGVNTVYVILVAATFKQLLEYHYAVEWNIRAYILLTAIPIFLVGIIRSMKYLVPFSALANALLLIGLSLTFYYMLEEAPEDSKKIKYKFAPIKRFPLFFSTAMFGMEGIGTTLPIHKSMKKPEHFLGFPGVLTIAMSIVVSLFCIVGFYGYSKYGEDTLANIVLNIRQDSMSEMIKLLIALAILFSYGLQLTASMDVVWHRLLQYIKSEDEDRYNYYVRTAMIVGTVILAIVVPTLGPVISLVGAVGFSMCGFFFPAVVETVSHWDGRLGKFKWILWKNICLMILAIFALCCGSVASISAIVKDY